MRKLMDCSDLVDEGYLAEVNRQFFHPLGLAMCVDVEFNEINILDSRADLEGFYFKVEQDAALAEELVEKAAKIKAEQDIRRAHREYALGYFVQPVSSKEEETDA